MQAYQTAPLRLTKVDEVSIEIGETCSPGSFQTAAVLLVCRYESGDNGTTLVLSQN